jgi:putative copper resistance protein D
VTGFIDVILRGLTLVCASLALGGVAWLRLVLRAEPHAKPDAAGRLALRVVGAVALAVAATQVALMLVALAALADVHGTWPIALYFETAFARVATLRAAIGLGVAVLALTLARRPAGPLAWGALAAGAMALVAASAALSHAVARVDGRALLMLLDAVHQIAAAVWVGGLAHLVIYYAASTRTTGAGHPAVWPPSRHPERGLDTIDGGVAGPLVVQRFSRMALVSVIALSLAGVGLTLGYVGEVTAFIGTAYGVMIVSKIVLFVVALAFASANFRMARRAMGPAGRLGRYVEVELGLAITVLFAAASLTSLPPAVDVREDRATVGEVAARFTPTIPRLVSPPVTELNRTAEPLMAPVGERLPIERAWSEYNHHWAGFFVVLMGLLAIAERLGLRAARHWPLVFLGLATFLFVRNDPKAWPLGPTGFWESLTLPDVLQHRIFVLLVVAFGIFEWAVRTGRLKPRPWGYVFPLLCAVGGGLLLTHSHAMFNLKQEFLTEVTHAPIGLLGAFAGWGRWLELRLPEASPRAGWLWTLCFTAVGAVLLVYREA